jgi:hypothetical protein
MPTFEIPVVGAIDFPGGTNGRWRFELPMRGGEVPVDITADGEVFTKAMLEEIKVFIADAGGFDETARDLFRSEYGENDEGTVGTYLSHHAEELGEKDLLRIFGTAEPDDLGIDHLLDALRLERIGLFPGAEDFAAVFDYTIDSEATDYILAVEFDRDGEVFGMSVLNER